MGIYFAAGIKPIYSCCPEHTTVVIGVVGLNIGIGMGNAMGMIIGSRMEGYQELRGADRYEGEYGMLGFWWLRWARKLAYIGCSFF